MFYGNHKPCNKFLVSFTLANFSSQLLILKPGSYFCCCSSGFSLHHSLFKFAISFCWFYRQIHLELPASCLLSTAVTQPKLPSFLIWTVAMAVSMASLLTGLEFILHWEQPEWPVKEQMWSRQCPASPQSVRLNSETTTMASKNFSPVSSQTALLLALIKFF